MCNGTPFTVEKISPRVGFAPGTARSVGQRLTHRATGAPTPIKKGGQIEMGSCCVQWNPVYG